jgi:ABC-type multidrug transport system fused ATPase/permease subunit
LNGIFKFENVSFSYPEEPEELILNNISFEIMPHKMNAFVGDSGSGKSTIMQLMLRFYDPTHGRITLDGIDLK